MERSIENNMMLILDALIQHSDYDYDGYSSIGLSKIYDVTRLNYTEMNDALNILREKGLIEVEEDIGPDFFEEDADVVEVKLTSRGKFEFEREQKQREKKKARKPKRIPPKLTPERLSESFIDFGPAFPEVFYRPLENEINSCYASNLLNAVLLLSRKMIENLVYNLFEHRFPKEADLRWNISKNRPHDFSVILDNLIDKKGEFSQEEQRLIEKFLGLCKPFKREANSKAHNIMEYVENREQLRNLKVPEIVQIALKLVTKERQ